MQRHSKIKRRLKILTFTPLMILVFFTIVGSNNINYLPRVQNTAIINNINTRPWETTPSIPNQELDGEQRFLTTITYQMVSLPQPNTYEYTLLPAYSGVLINQQLEVKLPPKVILENEQETQKFQGTMAVTLVEGSSECYLQKVAADAFNKARSIVNIPLKSGYSRDCTRSYTTNLRFWRKYANNRTL
jgi:hypothetical protein